MKRWLPIALAFAIIAAAGIANGLWIDRWTPSTELDDLETRTPLIPMTIGDWQGKDASDPEFLEELKERGTIHSMISRIYQNRSTGEAVFIDVISGRPGPIATHNPLSCMPAGGQFGNKGVTKEEPFDLPGLDKAATFSYRTFASNIPSRPPVTVYWSWHTPDGWIAASDKDPRFAFVSQRSLTKLYVRRNEDVLSDNDPEKDPARLFIRDALPIINQTLFDPATKPTAQVPSTSPAA